MIAPARNKTECDPEIHCCQIYRSALQGSYSYLTGKRGELWKQLDYPIKAKSLPGLEFVIEDTGDGIKLKPLTPYLETKAEELLGCVGYNGPKISLKEMEAAIAKGARKKL